MVLVDVVQLGMNRKEAAAQDQDASPDFGRVFPDCLKLEMYVE